MLMFWLKEDMFWPTEECSGQPKHYMFQAKEALLCPKEECSEPCHSSPTWGAINYFLFSLQNLFPICSTSAPHVSLKIGSVPQKTLFPIYTGHIVPQIASLPMSPYSSSWLLSAAKVPAQVFSTRPTLLPGLQILQFSWILSLKIL